MELKQKIRAISNVFKKEYPEAKIALNFTNPLELLIATILSAQCTDKRVNEVTKTLFKKYIKASDYAQASLEELEQEIKSTGFFKNKAKSIKTCCQLIVQKYRGNVPNTMDDLVSLSGVGRKTANVILGNCFNIPSIVVDTHVKRLSNGIGLSNKSDPAKIEEDLMKIIPKEEWTLFSHLLIFHGRNVCLARKPQCYRCVILRDCNYSEKNL